MSLPLMYLVVPYPLELSWLELVIRESNSLPPSFSLASIIILFVPVPMPIFYFLSHCQFIS
ncbi:uncharacterized protein DS421_15g505330 [Arachis hypogaea]|nr:uncharacterized protein DS421_15g505330 [Arachis hypogaea]